MGILTAIWAGFSASLFASSKHNIYGPAGALSGILLAFSVAHGATFVPFVAIGAGGIIFVVYAFRLSKYVTLIPSSALHGFLLGVGVTIAASQLNNAL
jgi:SulP family sulfate permease